MEKAISGDGWRTGNDGQEYEFAKLRPTTFKMIP